MAITKLTEYEANETEWPGYLDDSLDVGSPLGDEQKLANCYYDAQKVFYIVKDKTGNSAWNTSANLAQAAYATYYVDPNGGVVPGYWSFPHGLTEDYIRNADTAARTSARLLRDHGSYHNVTDNSDDLLSRENAYALMAHIQAIRYGDSPDTVRIAQLYGWAKGHIDQWCTLLTADYFRPFMGALTAQALIDYYTYYSANAEIITYLATMADYMHSTCWDAVANSWNYTDRDVGSTDPVDLDPQPDLNLLIVPYLGWLWVKTGDPKWKTRGDLAFDGGVSIYDGFGFWVSGAYLGGKSAASVNGKHVCQNFRWSRQYLTWRDMTPEGSGGAGHRNRVLLGVG